MAAALVLCSLLTAAAAFNQAPLTDSARVSGQVFVEGTTTPIDGASVMLIPAAPRFATFGPPPQALTDRDGRFAFEGVAPGAYRLAVQRTGFAPIVDPARILRIQVAAGQTLHGVALYLAKGAVIAGTVLDTSGKPLPDIRVMALHRGGARDTGPRLLPASGSGQQTNDIGEFRISSLAPGEYFVAAMPRLGASPFGAPVVMPTANATAITTTYYPGTTDPAAAHAVTVGAGETVNNIVFTIQSSPAFRVSGQVVDENGQPIAGAMVTLLGDPRGGPFMGPVGHARTGDDGRFTTAEVTAGTYRVSASVPISMSPSGRAGGSFSFTSGASVGGADQAIEVVVTDADVGNVRVAARRPAVQ